MDVVKVPVSFRDERGEIIDVLKKGVIEYVTIIRSRKGAVRANHFHKDTYQYVYVLEGSLRVVSQMPDEPVSEVRLEAGDLILNVPDERHAFEALSDTTFLVLTRGPRGGDDYERDTFRLDEPLIAPRRIGPA
ncbi:MAG TPA: cupin domain-containing protein [Candidatus Sulfotelmatobacter sp.]|nr:cupin domain-containing protein [Candidatus Sulfotelmatobacter sp.]